MDEEDRICTPSKELAEEFSIKLNFHEAEMQYADASADDLISNAFEYVDEVYEVPSTHRVWALGEKGMIFCSLAIVEDDNEAFQYYYSPEATAIVIEGLYVEEEYRGQGIGKRLLEYALNYCKKNYPELPVKLAVAKRNEMAIHFYERHGFVISGKTKDYFIMNSHKGLESYKCTVNRKPKQKIHGCLDWNDTLNIDMSDRACLRFRDRKSKEVISQACVEIIEGEQGFEGWIFCFATNPKYREQGFGTKLLKKAEDYLWECADGIISCIKLHAQKEFEDTLIPFYESRGYTKMQRDPLCKDEYVFVKTRED